MDYFIFKISRTIKLLDFLTEQRQKANLNRNFSRESWQREIQQGKFKANQHFIGENYLLKEASELHYYYQKKAPEPKVNKNLAVVYEDEYLMVMNKPAPLPMHPCGSYFFHTLTSLLQKKDFFTLNRIDSETSGLVFLAKKNHIKSFTEAFLQSNKYYLVLVYGAFPASLKVDLPLGRLTTSLVHKKRGPTKDGKKSLTFFRKIVAKNNYSLVLAHPLTGRTHQIRAHLLEKKFPVVGDKIYGKNENYFIEFLEKNLTRELVEKLEIPRHFLHSYKNIFYHPILKKKIIFQAKLPDDLANFLEQKEMTLTNQLTQNQSIVV